MLHFSLETVNSAGRKVERRILCFYKSRILLTIPMTTIIGQIPLPILIVLARLVGVALALPLEAREADNETDGTTLSVSL